MTSTTAATAAQPPRRRIHTVAAMPAVLLLTFAAVGESLALGNHPSSSIHSCAKPHPKFEVHWRQQQRQRVRRSSTTCCFATQQEDTVPAVDGNNVQQSTSSSDSSTFLSKLFKRDLSVQAVLLAAFLNLLGFTMASPIQPALGKHFSLPLGASFGSLSSAYPLGMLLGVFLWPTLSDVLGRKIVMSLTLFGSGIGLMLQSWGIHRMWTLEQFLLARVLTGCFAGNSPISKAYLADRGTEKGDLTKYLAWKDAASTMAFIVGPVFGGLVYKLGGAVAGDNTHRLSFVIFCSAVASLVASMSVTLFVKNTEKDKKFQSVNGVNGSNSEQKSTNENSPAKVESGSEVSKAELVSCPLGTKLWTGVASVACVSALYHAADSAFFTFFPSLLQNRLGFDTQAVGLAFTSFAFVSFSMSAFVSSRFLKAFGPVAACTAGLGAVGTGLMTLGYAASLPAGASLGVTAAFILGAAGLYYTGVPLYGPSVPTMLLQCVPSHKRGAVMGFDGAVNTLARVISPLVMGEIHRVKGAGVCFMVAGTCVYTAVSVALFRRWLVMRKLFARSDSVAKSE